MDADESDQDDEMSMGDDDSGGDQGVQPEEAGVGGASAGDGNMSKNTKKQNNTKRDVAPTCLPLPQKVPSHNVEVAVVNARSVLNKIDDVGSQIQVGQIDVMLLSETWETPDTSMGTLIEALEQTYALQWHGRGRDTRRGGGVGIVVNNSFGTAKKLDICEQGIETVWVEITPHYDPNLTIIAAAFYSSSTKEFKPEKEALQNHILDNMEILSRKHARIAYVIGGDLNSDTLCDLENLPSFKQAVNQPTRKDRVLDRLYTDLEVDFCVINPPLAVQEASDGSDSDHHIPVVGLSLPKRKRKRWQTILRRKYTKEAAENFLADMTEMDWSVIDQQNTVDEKAKLLRSSMRKLYDKHFPFEAKKVKIGEAMFFNNRLGRKHRRIQRLRVRPGRRNDYKKESKDFKDDYQRTAKEFFNRVFDEARAKDSARWHAEVKKLMANGFVRTDTTLPDVPGMEGMTDEQKANVVADSLESIAAGRQPLDQARVHAAFPVGQADPLQLEDVSSALLSMKVPKGLHEADPPRQLLLDHRSVFAVPLLKIFSACLEEGAWPEIWKEEHTSLIIKRKPVKTTDDFRPIVLTDFFSKCLETIVRKRLLDVVDGKLDDRQFGGLAGQGPDHYFTSLYQAAMDFPEHKLSSVLVTLDYSKAFNMMSRESVIESAAAIIVKFGS